MVDLLVAIKRWLNSEWNIKPHEIRDLKFELYGDGYDDERPCPLILKTWRPGDISFWQGTYHAPQLWDCRYVNY